MLYKPERRSALSGILPLLDAWNAEADYFRRVATAALRGDPPPRDAVAGAQDAQQGLANLLEEIDEALVALPAGHADFRDLLQAQITALSLHESIGYSLDLLDRFVPTGQIEPLRIHHPRPTLQLGR